MDKDYLKLSAREMHVFIKLDVLAKKIKDCEDLFLDGLCEELFDDVEGIKKDFVKVAVAAKESKNPAKLFSQEKRLAQRAGWLVETIVDCKGLFFDGIDKELIDDLKGVEKSFTNLSMIAKKEKEISKLDKLIQEASDVPGGAKPSKSKKKEIDR